MPSVLTLQDTIHTLANTVSDVNGALRSTMRQETVARQKAKLTAVIQRLQALTATAESQATVDNLTKDLTSARDAIQTDNSAQDVASLKDQISQCTSTLHGLNTDPPAFTGFSPVPFAPFTHYTYHEPNLRDGDYVEILDRSQKRGTFCVFKDQNINGKDMWRFGVVDENDGYPWRYDGLKSQDYLERLTKPSMKPYPVLTEEESRKHDKQLEAKLDADREVWFKKYISQYASLTNKERKELINRLICEMAETVSDRASELGFTIADSNICGDGPGRNVLGDAIHCGLNLESGLVFWGEKSWQERPGACPEWDGTWGWDIDDDGTVTDNNGTVLGRV